MKNEFIDDLTKAIDLGQQMAEILKKSQMSLFGDPHHVGYERTSASGTVSHIQAKGAQGLPEHHMEASHHADNISYDLATNGLSHHTHAEAAAAHQHAMNLHHQAAKLYKEDSTPYTYHMRKNQHHFETSLEHEREQNRQDKLTANPEPKDAEPVTVETANQAGHKIPKPPTPQTGIPTSRVTVEHMEHLMAHGHDPKGKGTWMFSRHRKIDFAKHKAGEDYITTPSMNYAEAKKHAKQWAASKGHSLIWTMP
jgi:chemotaxis protein histidine kinase CheA